MAGRPADVCLPSYWVGEVLLTVFGWRNDVGDWYRVELEDEHSQPWDADELSTKQQEAMFAAMDEAHDTRN